MSRPRCVVNAWNVPGEKRPRLVQTPGVAAIVRPLGDTTGLTRMGVNLRTVEPGFAGTNRHYHTIEEEWTYVVAGSGTVRIGPHRIPVSAGTFVGFPPGPRPHHFLADRGEPLVLLEGGERRPAEDGGAYPDARKMWRAGPEPVEPYVSVPEEGDPRQCVRVADVAIADFQHDVDAGARRRMRKLHVPAGLTRQAVCWAQVVPGTRSTAFHTHDRTDEWIFVLAGRALVRVGDERFEAGAGDFLGHPAGGAAHVMEAVEELTYLVGGQIDATDVVTYPEARMRRAGGRLEAM